MSKKIISMLALGIILGGGVIGAYQVMAQGATPTKTKAPTIIQERETQGSLDYKDIAGETKNEKKNEKKNEQTENKALLKLAKITPMQAKKIAETKIGGLASKTEKIGRAHV